MRMNDHCPACRQEYGLPDSPDIRWFDSAGQEVEELDAISRDDGLHYARCREGHVLVRASPTRPSLTISVFGQTLAGKDALLKAMGTLLSAGALASRRLSATIEPESGRAFELTFENGEDLATLEATPEDPRVPMFYDLMDRDSGQRINLVLYNSAGGDIPRNATPAEVEASIPHAAMTDVFVMVVPPPVLGVGVGEGEMQTLVRTLDQFARLEDYVNLRSDPGHERLAILALTKCDRYRGLRGFPDSLLAPRHHGPRNMDPMGIVLYNEQRTLYDFVVDNGGQALIDRVAGVGRHRVFLVAVSGTGKPEAGLAPDTGGAVNRALDPIIIPLLRSGMGLFSPTPGTTA